MAIGLNILEQAQVDQRAGLVARAEEGYRQVLAAMPDHPSALRGLGQVLSKASRWGEAVEVLRRACDLSPMDAAPLSLLGVALEGMGRSDEAVGCFRRAVELAPGTPQLFLLLGKSCRAAGALDEAEAAYRRAVTLRPDHADSRNALGALLLRCGELDGALAELVETIRLAPDHAEAFSNMAAVLFNLGRDDEAISCGRRAIALQPGFVAAHFHLAVALLVSGAYGEGLAEYEWRRKRPDFVAQDFPQPEWRGEPIAGKTILLYGDQGLGDAIQFVRYAGALAGLGATVVVATHARAVPLFRTVPGVSVAVGPGEALPPFDLHLPLLSTAHRLGTRVETIPAPIPYILADPAVAARWHRRLASCAGLKVGLAWWGAAGHPDNSRRSLGRDDLQSLSAAMDGVAFVSLQLGPAAAFAGPHVVDFGEEAGSLEETAGLIAALDLVVSVDTAIAHLAGAMGKPVWILTRVDNDWRWLRQRSDSPWYPTASLVRQSVRGDWSSAIGAVRQGLATLLQG